MFGLESLDVVIGLFFVYLLLSLICVALNETIAHFLHVRGKMLQDAIYQLLLTKASRPDRKDVAKSYGKEMLNKSEPHAAPGFELAATLYAHPLIASMKERYSLRVLNFFRRKGLSPSYIPSRTFVTVLLDVLRREIAEGKTPDATGTTAITTDANANVKAPDNKPAVVTEALPTLESIPKLAAQLETKFGPLGQVLRLLADQAGEDLAKFEKGVEQWFDDSMDRLGASYKRRVHLVGMLVAIVVAVSVNANTINIVRTLSTNTTLRQALVGIAEQAVKDSTNRGIRADTTPVSRDSALEHLSQLTGKLNSLGVVGLPIGYPPLSDSTEKLRTGSRWTFTKAVFKERWPVAREGWLGLLLTAFAISLGAPFWFDLLNKAVSIRSSGAKPEEADEERKKAKQ